MSLTEFDQELYDRNRRREGWEEGEKVGFEQGERSGIVIGKQETARNMLARNYPVTDIAEITGLPLADVEKLAVHQ